MLSPMEQETSAEALSVTTVQNLTISANDSYVVGNTVVVNIRFNVSANVAAGNSIIKGLPRPKTSASYGSGCVSLSTMSSDVKFAIANTVNDNGVVLNSAILTPLTSGAYIISGTYIKA